jgi:DNA adenine methylase
MLTNLHKTPFPWFGGKADAAPLIWGGLGDVAHYVEPFAGSLAVLLRRPHEANRTYYSETVNDFDALLCNFWRALAADPEGVADAASWPVSEADLFARHLALVNWRGVERLRADPEYYDAKMAGWWAWGQSCWIGGGWCSGHGAWVVGTDGVVRKRERGESGGVSSRRPQLSTNGQGINRPQLREPGVGEDPEFHPMTMPELRRWLRFLAARLRHVRILCGDWSRACTSGALKTLPVRQGQGKAGVFLDPPYGDVRDADLYAHDSLTIAAEVRAWCLANGDDPDLRIVLAGFDEEHVELEAHGWRVVEWYKAGFLKGGMGSLGKEKGNNQHRERLWLSPHCLQAESVPTQGVLSL